MERHRRTPGRASWTRAGLIVGVLIAAAVLATAAIARVAGGPSDRVIALPGRFPAAIALDDIHHRLVLDESGAVSLLNTDTGTLAHVIPVGAWRPAFSGGSGPALAVDPGSGRAIVALSSQPQQSTSAPPGAARILDTVTGRVVASPHVGVGDTAIVAVPGTGPYLRRQPLRTDRHRPLHARRPRAWHRRGRRAADGAGRRRPGRRYRRGGQQLWGDARRAHGARPPHATARFALRPGRG